MKNLTPRLYMARARRRAGVGLAAGIILHLLARYVIGVPWLALIGAVISVISVLGLGLAHWLQAAARAKAKAEAEAEDGELYHDPEFQAVRWNLGLTPDDDRDRVRSLMIESGYVCLGGRWVRIKKHVLNAEPWQLKARRHEGKDHDRRSP